MRNVRTGTVRENPLSEIFDDGVYDRGFCCDFFDIDADPSVLKSCDDDHHGTMMNALDDFLKRMMVPMTYVCVLWWSFCTGHHSQNRLYLSQTYFSIIDELIGAPRIRKLAG